MFLLGSYSFFVVSLLTSFGSVIVVLLGWPFGDTLMAAACLSDGDDFISVGFPEFGTWLPLEDPESNKKKESIMY